jgi:phage regulator Rha-like protein
MIKKKEIINIYPEDSIASKIHVIRNTKVMMDFDLAELYDIETKQLKRQVKRNLKRFPEDFMFQLNREEYNSLRCQTGTLKRGQHSKYLPYAFTEQGVAMLATVLNSDKAIQVNIQIIRVFLKFREFLASHLELRKKIEKIENQLADHDEEISAIFKVIKELIQKPHKQTIKKEIGFHTSFKNK